MRRSLVLAFALATSLSACSTREQPGRYQMSVVPATPVNDTQLLVLDTATGEGKIFIGRRVGSFNYAMEEFTPMRDMKPAEPQQ